MPREISIFMPAYNSANFIVASVKETYAFLFHNFDDFELCIVDDSSTDNTLTLLNELAQEASFSKLRILNYTNGPSRRENLGKAMLEAKYGIVLYQDSDLSVGLKNITYLFEAIHAEGFDVAIGSRFLDKKPNRSLYRKSLSVSLKTLITFLFSSKVKDHIIGFKAFKKDVYLRLYEKQGYESNFVRGWFWDAEILIWAQKHSYKIKEIGVDWDAGVGSTFSFKREVKMLLYIFKFYRKLNAIS